MYITHNSSDMLAVAGILAAVLFVVAFIVLAIAAIIYVFESLAIFTIAKRRKIKNYGLAWVPVANTWIFGSIADQYDYITTGRRKNARYLLLTFDIALLVIAFIFVFFAFIAGLRAGTSYAMYDSYYGNYGYDFGYNNYGTVSTGITVAVFLLFALIISAVSVAYLVFFYISLYKIYKSCSPENAVVFLVLSIFFNITIPFFLFAVRNKDLGCISVPAGSAPIYDSMQSDFLQPDEQIPATPVTDNHASSDSESTGSHQSFNDPKSADYNPYARQTNETTRQEQENPYNVPESAANEADSQGNPPDKLNNNE